MSPQDDPTIDTTTTDEADAPPTTATDDGVVADDGVVTDDEVAPGDGVAGGWDATDDATTRAEDPPPPPAPAWPVPVPGDPSARRNWASAAHWSAIAAALLGGMAFLGPLVVWLTQRDRDRWVAAHAVESLNFQLTWLVGGFAAAIVGVLLTLVTVGFALLVLVPAALVALVAWFVLPIRAAIAASRAEEYRYPLTVRLIQA